MIEALEQAGGHPRYTEFVVLTDEEERTDPLIKKHNAWTKAYATEELYDWLLENRRP
jgi:predicted peptidase